jgi:hypothetical protein
MQHHSTARSLTLARLASAPSRPRERDRSGAPKSSGFFTTVDEFAGIDRLDREELDEDPCSERGCE